MCSVGAERRKQATPALTPEGNVVMSFSFESYQLEEEECQAKDIPDKGVLTFTEPGELLACVHRRAGAWPHRAGGSLTFGSQSGSNRQVYMEVSAPWLCTFSHSVGSKPLSHCHMCSHINKHSCLKQTFQPV